ncbi:unnamed protein product, partial [Ixodes pacificus]
MALKARIENGIVYSPYPSEPVPEMTLYQVVKQCLEQYGCRTALVWDDEDITFAELLKMCQRYAAGFQSHGVKKGEKVLVHLDTSLENIIAMYSVIFAGGVAVVSDLILSNGEEKICQGRNNAVEVLCGKADARAFFRVYPALCLRRVSGEPDVMWQLIARVQRFQGYFSVGTAPGFVSVSDFKKLNEDAFQELPVADVKKEAVALLYTSGTTGSPKAAEHTHYSIVAFLTRP